MKKIKNLKLTSGKSSVLGIMWRGGKKLLCKLTLDGAFSLAIGIRFRLRRVLASKSPPIEKSTLVPCFRFEMVGGRVLPFPARGNLPVKDKTILAKTPQFSRFLSNSRLKYGKYVCVRLCPKSSKISAFWSLASLAASF